MGEDFLLWRQGDAVHVEDDLGALDVEHETEHVALLPCVMRVPVRRGEMPQQLPTSVVGATKLVVADAEAVLQAEA